MKAAGLVLAGFLVLGLGLQVRAIHVHSLSGDGAYHLLAGHQALRYGQNTLNLEHPPLVKLVVSLPLLFEDEPLAEPLAVDEALVRSNLIYRKAELIRRATVRGRYLALVIFVLPFFVACYFVGRRWGDDTTGMVLVLTTGLSLAVLPYLSVLQTDVAVSLAFLLTLLAAESYRRCPGWGRAVLIGLASGLALAVKFSGLLLGPVVLLAFGLASASWRRRLGQLILAGLAVLLVLEASYAAANPRYDSETGRETIRIYCENRGTLAVDERLALWQETLLAVERVDPRLAQWLTGFLGVRIQNAIGIYPSYAFGEVRSAGRWWYFPVVLLIKTPLAILAVALLAFVGMRSRRSDDSDDSGVSWVLPTVTVAVYLLASMTSNYNLSVRHMLPITPLLYLPVARFLAWRPRAACVVVGILAVESLALMPLWMSSTNTWWLGDKNPTRFVLSAGNLEYRQNFNVLARHVEDEGLEPIYVLYPALPGAVPRAYLPSARMKRPGDELESGWYAVNVTVEQMLPALLAARPEDVYNYDELHGAAQAWQPFWQAVVERGEDHGWIAGTFHLYRLE